MGHCRLTGASGFSHRPLVGGGIHTVRVTSSQPVPRAPRPGRALGDLCPALIAEWDAAENGEVTPFTVGAGSAFVAAWVCRECGHRWSTPTYSRGRGAGCPECKKKATSVRRSTPKPGGSLAEMYPTVAKDWLPSLNGGRTAAEVAAHAGTIGNWRCIECTHEWANAVTNRTRPNGNGCPRCWANRHSIHMARVLNEADSLAIVAPTIADEWDYSDELNAGACPWTVMAISGRRAAWKCSTCSHRWTTRVSNRTANGSRCAPCSRRNSQQESALHAFLGEVFELDGVGSVPRTDGLSSRAWGVDVLSSAHGFVVEFDGAWWHSEKCNPGAAVRDSRKAEDLRSQGWVVVRVREVPLVALHGDDLVVPVGLGVGVLGPLVVDRLVSLDGRAEVA